MFYTSTWVIQREGPAPTIWYKPCNSYGEQLLLVPSSNCKPNTYGTIFQGLQMSQLKKLSFPHPLPLRGPGLNSSANGVSFFDRPWDLGWRLTVQPVRGSIRSRRLATTGSWVRVRAQQPHSTSYFFGLSAGQAFQPLSVLLLVLTS